PFEFVNNEKNIFKIFKKQENLQPLNIEQSKNTEIINGKKKDDMDIDKSEIERKEIVKRQDISNDNNENTCKYFNQELGEKFEEKKGWSDWK
ncbi:hypothetical protein ACFL2K_00740, partial [Candidatus Margulisiibacteriota bacterium]